MLRMVGLGKKSFIVIILSLGCLFFSACSSSHSGSISKVHGSDTKGSTTTKASSASAGTNEKTTFPPATNNSTTSSGSVNPSTSAANTQSGTLITSMNLPNYGQVLSNGAGYVVYINIRDGATNTACSGPCLTYWPPVTGHPAAGFDVSALHLSTFTNSNGETQISYYGHPLYLYSGDHTPGEFNGLGIAGVWYLVGVNGSVIK